MQTSEKAATLAPQVSSARGWLVTFSGTGINLMLGVLYTWSVFRKVMQNKDTGWGWSAEQGGIPYAFACLLFALAMIPAGRLQDRLGPRFVATIGGVLVGCGMLLCWLAGNSFTAITIGFGILVGTGIGFGYASATPPAIKWFPPRKTGMIAGFVVSGFGLAAVYMSPLATALLNAAGLQTTFLILGISFLIIVILLAQLLKVPPAGYKPVDGGAAAGKKVVVHGQEMTWLQMLKTPQFYLLWLMYFCSAGVGLMMIGQIANIAKTPGDKLSVPLLGMICVMLTGAGNGAGRIIAGLLSDKIGRTWTMFSVFLVQALMLLALIVMASNAGAVLYVLTFICVGFNYGACLSVFPSATKDYFGLKNFGMNYGFVFTSWGIGAFILTLIAGKIITRLPDGTLDYSKAFFVGIGVLVVAMILTFLTKPPKHHAQAAQ
jgi:OFA family oxalate/formate antiporter-like MFS transporter